MRGLIVETLEGVLTLIVLIVVLLGIAFGVGGAPEIEAAARSMGWSIADSWNWKLVGGTLGALAGTILSSVVFGLFFILLDIRAQLVEANRLAREAR